MDRSSEERQRRVEIRSLQRQTSALLRKASLLAQKVQELTKESLLAPENENKIQSQPAALAKDDGELVPEISKDELYQRFKDFDIKDSDAQALANNKPEEASVSLVLGYKMGCGSCTEVLKELYPGNNLNTELFSTITTTSDYYNKILNTYKINGNPFLLIISQGKVLPPILGWSIVKTLKSLLK